MGEEQKYGIKSGRRLTSLAFGSGWTALGCIDPNNNNYYYLCWRTFQLCKRRDRKEIEHEKHGSNNDLFIQRK